MKDFAKIHAIEKEPKILYAVELNPNSIVYQGHFPNQPVAPGVMLIKAISDCLEDHLGQKLNLISSRSMKFLKLVTPSDTPIFQIEFSIKEVEDSFVIKSVAKSEGDILFKFDGKYSA
jgi:3-hydroxyacyl-[acyl-carrier-protein] dehydratase